MKAICQNILIVSLALGGVFTACQEEDTIEQTIVETILPETGEEETTQSSMLEAYNAAWVETLGEIDPNHDWSAAMRVTAKIYLREAAGEHTVRIYTHNPSHPDCRILANTKMTGTGTISFDALKTQEEVFIKAINKNGRLTINDYYKISDNSIHATNRLPTSRAISDISLDTVDILGTYKDYTTKEDKPYENFYYINGNPAESTKALWYYEYYKPIIGDKGVFKEQNNNRKRWKEQMHLEDGISYKTTSEGPIELSYMFGCTAYYNMFGYFYYTDEEDIATVKKYILMKDARPQTNIKQASSLSADSQYVTNQGMVYTPTNYYYGSKYKLIYFDENGNPSYDFPQGINIAFFLIMCSTSGDNANIADFHDINNVYYSIPSLNLVTSKTYAAGNEEPADETKGEISAVTYNYNSITYLGFEDGTDKDMNDIMFIVDGNIGEPENIAPPAQTWIVACEDLGSADDYDFNDIVFSVSHVAGEETATIVPLAAGGICASYLLYDNSIISKVWDHESLIHQLFDDQLGVYNLEQLRSLRPINVDAADNLNVGKAKPITINVGQDFTITNWGKFKINVINQYSDNFTWDKFTSKDGIYSAVIIGNNHNDKSATAPQMICIPEGWKWPKERQLIYDVYPQFKDWNQDQQSNLEWYKTIGEGKENAVFSFE